MDQQRAIDLHDSLLQALKKMDKTGYRSLLVVNKDGEFEGILSIGDIQRAIIKNISLDSRVSQILRINPKIASENDTIEKIKEEMIKYRMEFLPLIDKYNRIKEIYYWEDIFKDAYITPFKKFNLPVIIMAGGLGTRLSPLTNVLPKPLIPLGEKTIIEEIFDRFGGYGCDIFYVSLNYKADLIEYYLKNLELDYRIELFRENKPMGTAGSLSIIRGKINKTVFVSNCDILIEQDYSEILDYHEQNNNDITVVAALKHLNIPYGTLETGENGMLLELKEKPEIVFKINSGMYILEPEIMNLIPEGKFYHITDLILQAQEKGKKVGVFPVSEKSWKDIGSWDTLLRHIQK